MTLLFTDGFDHYGPAGQTAPTVLNLVAADGWNPNSSSLSIVAPLSSGGQALIFPNGASTYIARALSSSYSRVIGGIRFASNLSGQPGIFYQNNTSAAFAISINQTTGLISIRTGNVGGSALATSAGSVSANSIHYLEWDVTIGASASYQVWLDGVSILSGTGNTGNGQTSVNTFGIGTNTGSLTTGGYTVDDLYLFSSAGSYNNAPLLNNPIVETSRMTADATRGWTNNATLLGNSNSATSNTNAPGSNQVFLRPFTASANMTLNSVSCRPGATSGAAKFKSVLYSGITAGSSLIATGAEVVGATSGATLTSSFSSGQSLTAGTTYAIGFITDTSVVLNEQDTTLTGAKAANTYTSGAPATLPAMTSAQASWQVWGNCTGASADWVDFTQNPGGDDLSYMQSSTVGDKAYYTPAVLGNTPASIASVSLKVRAKRSDSGTRTFNAQLNSGTALDQTGSASGFTPPSSYAWETTVFEIDPNTGSPWAGSGRNAISVGMQIAS